MEDNHPLARRIPCIRTWKHSSRFVQWRSSHITHPLPSLSLSATFIVVLDKCLRQSRNSHNQPKQRHAEAATIMSQKEGTSTKLSSNCWKRSTSFPLPPLTGVLGQGTTRTHARQGYEDSGGGAPLRHLMLYQFKRSQNVILKVEFWGCWPEVRAVTHISLSLPPIFLPLSHYSP